MNYEKTIEPFVVTNDLFLLEFVAQTLHDYPSKKREWTKMLLKESMQNLDKAKFILLYIKVDPEDESLTNMIINGLNKVHDSIRHFYVQILLDFTPEIILKNRYLLSELIPEKDWTIYKVLVQGSKEEIWKEYMTILNRLENEASFDLYVYQLAKKIAYTLVRNNYITKDQLMMMFESNIKEDMFHYDGYLAVYMLGLVKVKEAVGQLATLLTREDDMLLEEVAETLISLQSNDVVDAVAPYLMDEEANIFATSIIENIKTEHAVNVLIHAYSQVDEDMQGTIFEALVHQLSIKAEPEIRDYLSKDEQSFMIDIDLLSYSYFNILGIAHPEMEIWKETLNNR